MWSLRRSRAAARYPAPSSLVGKAAVVALPVAFGNQDPSEELLTLRAPWEADEENIGYG
jgi:hypothetical protein